MRNIWKLMQLHVVWYIHQFQVFLWHSMSCICHVSTLSSYSLNCLTTSFFGFVKIRLHGWYHLRTFWRTLERFGDGRHFNFLLQLCCLFWFWSFMPNMESTEIRIFEYSCKRMRRWGKKDETAALQNSFGPIAFMRKSIEYLTPLVVGHIPLEISRFVYFFLERWENGGKGISKKVWGISNSKGKPRDSYTSDFQNWRRKKALSLEIGRFD